MKKILLTLFTVILTTTLNGQTVEGLAGDALDYTENQNGFGVRATAMGNAFVGVADDYSAIYYNPAGLAQIRLGQFSGAISHYGYSNDARYLGEPTSSDISKTKLQNFGVVFPLPTKRGSFVLALGYQKVKDFDNVVEFSGYNTFKMEEDPFAFDTEIQQEQMVTNEGSLSMWSFGGAIDLSRNFSFGLALNVYGGSNTFNADYYQEDINQRNDYILDDTLLVDQIYFESEDRLESDFSGYEFKAGGLFKLMDNLRLGGSVTFPMTLSVQEDWSFYEGLAFDEENLNTGVRGQYIDIVEDEGTFDYKIKVPFKFEAGASYQTSYFLVSASAKFTDWSQLKYDKAKGVNDSEFIDYLDANKVIKRELEPVTSWAVGGEGYLFGSKLALRGGMRYLPSPIKNLGTEYDRKYYTAGAGFKVDDKTTINASYIMGQWKTSSSYLYTWSAEQDIVTTKLIFGLNLKF